MSEGGASGTHQGDSGHEIPHTEMSSAGAASDLIHGARKMIAISGFLISDGGIVDSIIKQAEGDVRSYVVTATKGVWSEHVGSDKLSLEKCHSSMDKLCAHSLVYMSDDYCINAVVTDPCDNPRGMLLPAALTRDDLRHNEDLAVELDRTEAGELAEILKWAFWNCAMREEARPGSTPQDDRLAVVPRPLTTRVLQSSPGTPSLEDGLDYLLADPPKSVIASSQKWYPGHPAADRLIELAAGHTDVTVLSNYGKRHKETVDRLKDAGANILGFQWLGAEAVFADAVGIVMSSPFGPGSGGGMGVGIRVEGGRAARFRRALESWASQG